MNKAILMGRLTQDPELRTTPNGISVTKFSLAVNRRFAKAGEERGVDFINIVCWRSAAEFVAKYFKEGQQMALVGSIETRKWQDKEGNNRYATEVVADEVYFADSKKDTSQQKEGFTLHAALHDGYTPAGMSDFDEVEEDGELPF